MKSPRCGWEPAGELCSPTPLEEAREPILLKVVFNPDPQHFLSVEQIRAIVFQHPLAPQEVQAIVEQLEFKDAAEESG